jgi:methylmalonyl-CoA/ethylmalonyl-CoA epimerase
VALNFAGAFHHVGLACRNLEEEAASIGSIGYSAEGPSIEDPIQKVRVQFFAGAGPRIELITPSAPDSPIWGILKRGTKFYHLAYEVADFEATVRSLETCGFRAVGPAAPAIAFDMRRIVFVMSSTGLLVELIER